MLNTASEIIEFCLKNNKRIYDLVLIEELKNSKKDEKEIRFELSKMLNVMEASANENLEKEVKTKYRMIDGYAKKSHEFAKEDKALVGSFLMEAMAMSFSTSEVNGVMGKIVATPTAGSSGILPAAIFSMKKRFSYTDEEIQNAILTSIGIGQIIGKYANFSGAEGGCQAECGSAAAMASAAITELRGGSVSQILNSASIAIINVLGLVCDPVAGLVQYPCNFRNASGVVNAFICSDMAMAGIESIVPFEEVTKAMKEVGDYLPYQLRETGLAGIAGTTTGKKIMKDFLNER